MSRGYYNPGAPFLYTAPDSGAGMDCLQLRSPPGPFHYLISEQAKSLVALQELQHEVGALLEFRDLVIETFPNLRTKMASSTPATMTSHASNIPVAVRRDWEPGIRVRRKLNHKDDSSLGRSRSNSHSSKQQPKSGDTVSAIQDSGFSTETSSKETHSASSSTALTTSSATTVTAEPDETEDELWNLLDIIHRKGTRLRDEAEALQGVLREQGAVSSIDNEQCDFQRVLLHASVDDVRQLRRERDLLLDRVAEMEAEVLAGRVHTSRLQEDLENLLAAKQDLEEQLRAAVTQRGEVNTRIHDMHLQFVARGASSDVAHSEKPTVDGVPVDGGVGGANKRDSSSQRTEVKKTVTVSELDVLFNEKLPRVRTPDSKKVTAILKEQDPVVLQRHLLTSTVRNQVLQHRLETASKIRDGLDQQLEKAREDNDDLRFQLDNNTIELEGTRARMRVLEQLHGSVTPNSPDLIPTAHESVPLIETHPSLRSEITTASMKAMSPLPINLQMDHSSSTESAQDQAEQARKGDSVTRRRPSKIPLVKSYAAPKPPNGKHSPGPTARSRSGESPGRPPSSHSWRNKSEGNSLSGNKSNTSLGGKSKNGSLIAVRTGRDSLTGKVRNNDSLSKLRESPVNSSFTSNRSSKRDSSIGRKPSTPVRRASSTNARTGRDSPDGKNSQGEIERKSSSWVISSLNSNSGIYPDSLDREITFQPSTMETSSSHRFQTANTFLWNTAPTEYYDSIDSAFLNNGSMMESSFYQQHEENLAECDDSLEKHISSA